MSRRHALFFPHLQYHIKHVDAIPHVYINQYTIIVNRNIKTRRTYIFFLFLFFTSLKLSSFAVSYITYKIKLHEKTILNIDANVEFYDVGTNQTTY